jgi:hypothetical protein
MHSLEHSWKNPIDTTNIGQGKVIEKINKITKSVKVCKYVYSKLTKTCSTLNRNEEKWNERGLNIEKNDWNKYYQLPYITTIESKLRSFQYHILKRSLVTNTFLHMCNIIEDNKCDFCKEEPETLEHLFFECRVTKKFWNDVSGVLPKKTSLNKYLCKRNVMCGILNPENKIVNHLYLLVKCYIYINQCLKKRLHVQPFIYFVQEHYKIEEDIAFRRGKSIKNEQKWRIMYGLFDRL